MIPTKLVVSPIFSSSDIANMIPESPLNKIMPLTEDHAGGCTGTPVNSRTISAQSATTVPLVDLTG